MGDLWQIAQRHMDAYGVREAALARRMGISPQALSKWKLHRMSRLPEMVHLEALARETRTPYGDVLTAALRDIGYLPKAGDGDAQHAAPMIPFAVASDSSTLSASELRPRSSQRPDDDTPGTSRSR